MIQKLINQGYRLYEPTNGFKVTAKLQDFFLKYRDLVVSYNPQLNLILVRNATSKDRIQAGE